MLAILRSCWKTLALAMSHLTRKGLTNTAVDLAVTNKCRVSGIWDVFERARNQVNARNS